MHNNNSNSPLFESLDYKDMEGLLKPTIHVDEFEAWSLVLLTEGERGTRNRPLDTQGKGESLHKGRLACAKVACERKDHARR